MKKLYLKVTSGFYKPFSGEVFDGDACIGEIKEKNINLLRKILYFTVFRMIFPLDYEIFIESWDQKFYLKRKRIFLDDRRYFLKGQLNENIYVYEICRFRDFLKIDLTKPFVTAHLYNSIGEKVAYLTTRFGSYRFSLYDGKSNFKISEFEWRRFSKFLSFYSDCYIDFFSNTKEHLLLSLFSALVQSIIKQKR
ncbi:MAG: hypothetical protein N2257_07985 [Thermodesulfovibrionales bacterium]|nr:hypothetical protein [Thermodesulfovibrionales bacterium]